MCYRPGGIHLGGVPNLVALPCDDRMSQRSSSGQAKRAPHTVNSRRWVKGKTIKKSKKEVLLTHFAIIILHIAKIIVVHDRNYDIKICIACFIAFGVVATYWVVELIPSPFTFFSDCPINCSTEDKGTSVILGHIALRTSKSSGSRSFWDSILWIRPLGTSIDCVIEFLWVYCILAHYIFWIKIL